MTSDKRTQIWESLKDKDYRQEFVSADVNTGLATQIHLTREDRAWTQEQLAQYVGNRQETISQWENPDYGRYSLRTLLKLAEAFDVALLVKFVPFSELVDWAANLTSKHLAPPGFENDHLQAPRSTSERMQASDQWLTYQAVPGNDALTGDDYAFGISVEPTAYIGISVVSSGSTPAFGYSERRRRPQPEPVGVTSDAVA